MSGVLETVGAGELTNPCVAWYESNGVTSLTRYKTISDQSTSSPRRRASRSSRPRMSEVPETVGLSSARFRPETRSSKPETRDPDPGTRDLKPGTWNCRESPDQWGRGGSRPAAGSPTQVFDPQPETRNPKPETRNPKPETLNPKP